MTTQIDDLSKQLVQSELLERIGVDKYKFSDDQFSWWDFTYLKNGSQVVGEIKQRRCKSTTYSDTMLEKQKYDKLIACKHKGIFVALFDDCFYVFDTDKCNVTTGFKMCPATTEWNNNYVQKEVVYFNFLQGIKFEYNNKN